MIANLDFFICLRRAYAKLTSQAHLQNSSFREASGNLTSQAGLCTTQKGNCLRQAYANLPSQAGSSAPWPARRHPPHFGIFRLRDAYVMLTGCLREFSAAAILAKNILKCNQINCLRQAYANLTSQAHLQKGSFQEASANLPSQAGLWFASKMNPKKVAYAKLTPSLRAKHSCFSKIILKLTIIKKRRRGFLK